MGITIYYTFVRRRNPDDLLEAARREAVKRGMKILHLSPHHLVIDPHPKCESIELHWGTWKDIQRPEALTGQDADYWQWVKSVIQDYYGRLVHDDDWICLGFTKTQFAGTDVHCAVAEFLRFVASRCHLADIADEADYYEGGPDSVGEVKETFDRTNKLLSKLAATLKETFGDENVLCGQDIAEEMADDSAAASA